MALVLLLAACGTDTATTNPVATTASTTSTTTTTTTTSTEPPARDRTVATFTGEGAQSSRPFTVADGWEIQWDDSDDGVMIYVFTEGGGIVDSIGSPTGKAGSAFEPRGGTYYLKMNCIGSWTVRVVDVA